MFSNESKYQSLYGEIKQSHAYEKFHFKGKTKGIALKYVKEGYENYLINDEIIPVKQGQFILVPEDQEFEAKAKLKSQNIHGLCIDLNTTTLDTDLSKIYSNPLLFNLPFDCSYFSPLANKLKTIHSSSHVPNINYDQHLILKVLNEEIQNFADELSGLHLRLSLENKKTTTQRGLLIKLFASKNFIHRYFNQKIKLDELARYAGISKYHFLRLFKLCFQQSPQELQESLRMKKAIDLINNTTSHLSICAYELGYIDLATFSKKFKTKYGMSPSQYKKLIN